MSRDRDVMDRLVQVISELSEQGGEAERSRFYTGLIVLRNSGSATPTPAGFVQVRFEGVGQLARYFGNEPSVGDYVDVLMVYDQTPIILQNHTHGLSGAGWPFHTDCYTVDTADPDADYATIAGAIAAGGKNLIFLAPERFTQTAGLTMTASLAMRGMANERSEIYSTTIPTLLSTADNTNLEELMVTNNDGDAGTVSAILVTADDNVDIRRVRAQTGNNSGPSHAYHIDDEAANVRMWDCWGYGGLGSGSGYAIFVEDAAATGPTVYIYGGRYDGDTKSAYFGDNCTVYLYGPVFEADITVGTGVTIKGWYYLLDGTLLCAGDVNIGSTTLSQAAGHIYQDLVHDIYPDGESNIDAGFWTRYVNRYGLANYTTHCREGAGIPTGLTGWQVLAPIYVTFDPLYTGHLRGTFYQMMSANTAPFQSFLADTGTQPITAQKWQVGRFLVTGGMYIGLRADNYDAGRGYAVGERLYYYEILLYGFAPRTQITYNHGYWVWNGAAWGGNVNTASTAVTVHPISEGITLGMYINYGANSNTVAGYVVGEHGAVSNYGSVVMFVGAGVTPFGARRAGPTVINRVYVGSSFDWWHKTW